MTDKFEKWPFINWKKNIWLSKDKLWKCPQIICKEMKDENVHYAEKWFGREIGDTWDNIKLIDQFFHAIFFPTNYWPISTSGSAAGSSSGKHRNYPSPILSGAEQKWLFNIYQQPVIVNKTVCYRLTTNVHIYYLFICSNLYRLKTRFQRP